MILVRKFLIPILKFIISAGLIYYLFLKLGFDNVMKQLLDAKVDWFILGIVVFTLSNFLGSIQWRMLLKARGIDLSLGKVIDFYLTGLFFNNFLVGYIGGDAIRIYDVTKAGGKVSDAISTVFLDRFIGFAILSTMALFGASYWINLFTSNHVLLTIVIIFAYWVFLFVLLFNENLSSKVSWLFRYFIPERLKVKIREIYLGMNYFRNQKKLLLNVSLISIVIQSLRIYVHYIAARSIGVHIHPVYFIIFVPIIAMLASLPISIGGLGVRESSAVALFSQAWSTPADIVAFEFFAYLIGILGTVPGGIFFILRKSMPQTITQGES